MKVRSKSRPWISFLKAMLGGSAEWNTAAFNSISLNSTRNIKTLDCDPWNSIEFHLFQVNCIEFCRIPVVVLDSETDNAFKKHRNPGWRSRVPVFLKATTCILYGAAIFLNVLIQDWIRKRMQFLCPRNLETLDWYTSKLAPAAGILLSSIKFH